MITAAQNILQNGDRCPKSFVLALTPPPPPHPKPKPSPSSSPSPHPNQVAAKLATTPATIERCVQSTLAAAQARATATY